MSEYDIEIKVLLYSIARNYIYIYIYIYLILMINSHPSAPQVADRGTATRYSG